MIISVCFLLLMSSRAAIGDSDAQLSVSDGTIATPIAAQPPSSVDQQKRAGELFHAITARKQQPLRPLEVERCAFVTLLYGNSHNYTTAVRILYRSFLRTQSKAKFVVMVTSNVRYTTMELLLRDDIPFVKVNTVSLPEHFRAWHQLRFVLSKLGAWSLTQYDRVAFVDADAIFAQNPDSLFEQCVTSYVCGVLRSTEVPLFNTGVLLLYPDRVVHRDMLAAVEPTIAKWVNEGNQVSPFDEFLMYFISQSLWHFEGLPRSWNEHILQSPIEWTFIYHAPGRDRHVDTYPLCPRFNTTSKNHPSPRSRSQQHHQSLPPLPPVITIDGKVQPPRPNPPLPPSVRQQQHKKYPTPIPPVLPPFVGDGDHMSDQPSHPTPSPKDYQPCEWPGVLLFQEYYLELNPCAPYMHEQSCQNHTGCVWCVNFCTTYTELCLDALDSRAPTDKAIPEWGEPRMIVLNPNEPEMAAVRSSQSWEQDDRYGRDPRLVNTPINIRGVMPTEQRRPGRDEL